MAILTANNQSLTEITALPSVITTGSMVLLETETASSSSTLDFTSGIDSTYDEYVFKFYDIHPSHASTDFQFNGSIDAGSNYNVTKTTSSFKAAHDEGDSDTTLSYSASHDLAQGTGFQNLASYGNSDNGNDSCLAGTLYLFNPSSTTLVKHFIARTNYVANTPYSVDTFMAGYFNTTSDIDAIQFKFSANNIDAGVIKLYGVV